MFGSKLHTSGCVFPQSSHCQTGVAWRHTINSNVALLTVLYNLTNTGMRHFSHFLTKIPLQATKKAEPQLKPPKGEI